MVQSQLRLQQTLRMVEQEVLEVPNWESLDIEITSGKYKGMKGKLSGLEVSGPDGTRLFAAKLIGGISTLVPREHFSFTYQNKTYRFKGDRDE